MWDDDEPEDGLGFLESYELPDLGRGWDSYAEPLLDGEWDA